MSRNSLMMDITKRRHIQNVGPSIGFLIYLDVIRDRHDLQEKTMNHDL